MSEVGNGMEDMAKDGKYDKGGRNDIKVAANPCGAVYAMTLGTDAAIGSDFVAGAAKTLVAGKPTKYEDSSPYAGNTCDDRRHRQPRQHHLHGGLSDPLIMARTPARATRTTRSGPTTWTTAR